MLFDARDPCSGLKSISSILLDIHTIKMSLTDNRQKNDVIYLVVKCFCIGPAVALNSHH